MRSRVAVVVVNWNGLEDTRRCVASVLGSDYSALRVIVADNGSDHDDAGELSAAFPSIEVVRLADNYGYAAAANAGIDAARADAADLVLLLNNDTTVEPSTVSQLEKTWRSLGERSIVAPLILRPDGLIWSAGGILKWPWVAGEHIGLGAAPEKSAGPSRVDWASGCALFCSMAALDDIGGFDERFFLYLEDMDWCLRARRKGYAIWCAPEARITHEVTKTVNAMDPRITPYYAYRNFYLTGLRHAPLHWRAWLIGHLFVSLAKVVTRNALYSRYRRDDIYSARTRGLLDFIRGRTGKAPYAHEIIAARHAAPSEQAV
jgi:GT2 family glycosyltransferase